MYHHPNEISFLQKYICISDHICWCCFPQYYGVCGLSKNTPSGIWIAPFPEIGGADSTTLFFFRMDEYNYDEAVETNADVDVTADVGLPEKQ